MPARTQRRAARADGHPLRLALDVAVARAADVFTRDVLALLENHSGASRPVPSPVEATRTPTPTITASERVSPRHAVAVTITPREAARALGITVSYLNSLTVEGAIPRTGGRRGATKLYTWNDLLRWSTAPERAHRQLRAECHGRGPSLDPVRTPDDLTLEAERHRLLRQLLDAQSPSRRAALEGLLAGRTLEEIGAERGLTRERIRQLAAKAFRSIADSIRVAQSTRHELFAAAGHAVPRRAAPQPRRYANLDGP